MNEIEKDIPQLVILLMMALTREIVDFQYKGLKIGRLIFIINYIGYRQECTMRDIREYLNIQPSTATRQLDKLVNDLKLVQRVSSEKDRRNVILELADLGWEVYKYHKQIQDKFIHSFMGKFTSSELKVIRKILLELTNNPKLIPSL